MAPRPQGSGSQCPGLLMGSSNLVILPNLHHSSVIGGHPKQQIEVILICLRWTGAIWWPQLASLRTKIVIICGLNGEDCLSYPQNRSKTNQAIL